MVGHHHGGLDITTIAYRGGILAGDTRVTIGDNIVTDKQRKVWKTKDGYLLGAAGKVEDMERLRRVVRKGVAVDATLDISALLISPEGKVMLFEGNTWVTQKGAKYYAIGSGHDVALAAMDAGADAVKAVKIAIKRDTGSGGHVKKVCLMKRKEK